eukprot:1312092-Prymnesium_polylepis.1
MRSDEIRRGQLGATAVARRAAAMLLPRSATAGRGVPRGTRGDSHLREVEMDRERRGARHAARARAHNFRQRTERWRRRRRRCRRVGRRGGGKRSRRSRRP